MREAPPTSFPKMNCFLGSGAYLKHTHTEPGLIMRRGSDCNLSDVQPAPCFITAVCRFNGSNPQVEAAPLAHYAAKQSRTKTDRLAGRFAKVTEPTSRRSFPPLQ